MNKRPTKDMIKRTLQASQRVWLAKGYSAAAKIVYINNYNSDSIHFPEFGNWKSFAKIQNELRAAIDKEFPIVAFPYRVIEDEITLWQRNPNDIDYTRELGVFKVTEKTKED